MNFDEPKISPMQIGRRDISKPNHWETLDLNKYKLTKPTILCFGGNRSFEPKDANFYCRTVEEMLTKNKYFQNVDKNDYDLVGISYGHYPLKDENVEVSKLDDFEINLIEEKLFQPLYLNRFGKPLSVEKACKNFNKLTVLCHSYGAVAFDKIIKNIFQNMIKKGFSFEEVSDILSQVVCISYAPRGMIGGVSSIQIVSGCDGFDIPRNAPKKMRNTYYAYFYNLFNDKEAWGNGTQIVNGNTIGVFTTNMTINEKTDDHSFLTLVNGGKEDTKEKSKNAKSIYYVAQQSLAISLKNSVENIKSNAFKSKPNVEKLYSRTKYILGKKQKELEREL